MPNTVLLSPMIARLSGTMCLRNSALVLRYTGVGKASLITPKRIGGKETKTKLWEQTQWIWNYLDAYWSNLPQPTRNLWTRHAHNSKRKGRSGFGYFRSVNIMRLLFWFPVLPKPPNTCDSIKRSFVQCAQAPGLYPNVVKRVWFSGTMYPKTDPQPFDEELPYDPWLPTPPPPSPTPAPPPSPPWTPCYPETEFTITSTSGENGHLIPEGVDTYSIGQNPPFHASPDCGYLTDYFLIDGKVRYGINKWTFSHLRKDHTLHAEFYRTAYPIASDNFQREDGSPLGLCWYHQPSSNIPTLIYNESARATYVPLLGGFQTTIDNFERMLDDTSLVVEVPWDGLQHLNGTGVYQSVLKVLLGCQNPQDLGDYYWITVADNSPLNTSRLFFWRRKGGVSTELLRVTGLPLLDGTWEFEASEGPPGTWRLSARLDTVELAYVQDSQIEPFQFTGFSLRMRPITGVITSGYTEISWYESRVYEP